MRSPFQNEQLRFSAHLRNPDRNPAPVDVEPRRMAIYVRLIFNNIESFCAKSFPVAKSVLTADDWRELIRDFIDVHRNQSPFFSEIPQEFIAFLVDEREPKEDPPFLIELCHFEFHGLHLRLAADRVRFSDSASHKADRKLIFSPLARLLQYQWPVHTIQADNVPSTPPAKSTNIVAFRDRHHNVRRKVLQPLEALTCDAFKSPTTIEHVIRAVRKNYRGEFKRIGSTKVPPAIRQIVRELLNLDVLVPEEFLA